MLAASVRERDRKQLPAAASTAVTNGDGSAKLAQAVYWEAIQGYLRPRDVLYVDNGVTSCS